MTILTSARLRFEPLDDIHADGLHAMNSDPDVMRWLHGTVSMEETRAMIVRVRARRAAWGYSWWALLDAASGEMVGAGGIQHLGFDPANPHELGWRLRRASWGRGLATEAAFTLARHGFDALGAPRLCAIRHPGNEASRRVMDKLGMRYTGMQVWNGEEVPVHVLERRDWDAAHGAGAPAHS
ncbi:GNAT family N-acetyltransferase [Massilia sp. YIM B02763]|uniref:GNAT family N-acetyltransferase n=1 Tax=Massilia sp. YIM B02763 TaxID=3050130 RepID=UPI0025B69EFE|nr:GNAT family N-acetyltransferase [Massilia sp. YIM B02763]MDN4051805.1 GNAT family N-acetyltransferase [Massilia sp. YIM B02763]